MLFLKSTVPAALALAACFVIAQDASAGKLSRGGRSSAVSRLQHGDANKLSPQPEPPDYPFGTYGPPSVLDGTKHLLKPIPGGCPMLRVMRGANRGAAEGTPQPDPPNIPTRRRGFDRRGSSGNPGGPNPPKPNIDRFPNRDVNKLSPQPEPPDYPFGTYGPPSVLDGTKRLRKPIPGGCPMLRVMRGAPRH